MSAPCPVQVAILAFPDTTASVTYGLYDLFMAPRRDWGLDVRVPEAPTFPLRVTVRDAGEERTMRNVIHREGACAACHDRHGKGAASNGKVFVEKTP